MSELQRLEKPTSASCWWAAAISARRGWQGVWKDYSVKLIERDQQRAAELAEKLQKHDRLLATLPIRNCWRRSILIRVVSLSRY